MHCSWELNKKNIILLPTPIKLIFPQTLSNSLKIVSHFLSPLLAYLSLSSLPRLYDQPLVILGCSFSHCKIGLSLLTVVVIFLTTVGSFLILVLMLGFVIMCANGAFRVQKDLFLDDQEPANSGLLFFLGSAASFVAARVRPMPPIRLRHTSLLLIRPTPTLSSSSKPSSVIGDFLFCLWLVFLFGLGWRKILEIWVGSFFFFFFPSCWGLVVVVVVVVVVADGRGCYNWCCGFFWVVENIILL